MLIGSFGSDLGAPGSVAAGSDIEGMCRWLAVVSSRGFRLVRARPPGTRPPLLRLRKVGNEGALQAGEGRDRVHGGPAARVPLGCVPLGCVPLGRGKRERGLDGGREHPRRRSGVEEVGRPVARRERLFLAFPGEPSEVEVVSRRCGGVGGSAAGRRAPEVLPLAREQRHRRVTGGERAGRAAAQHSCVHESLQFLS